MMYLSTVQKNVLCQVGIEMRKAKDSGQKDSINKLYRQARIWNRFECCYADAITPASLKHFNDELKKLRDKNLEELK